MNINFDYSDEELNEIRDILIENLKLPDDENLNEKLNDLAKTAFYEYINMVSETGMPTKASDILQERVLYLIDHYFNKFPNENEIALLFNITNSKSRTILTNLKATHRNKLKQKLKEKIIRYLNSGNDIGENKWEFEAQSKPIIAELNELMSLKNPGLEKFKHKIGSSGKVTLHSDSLTFLKTEFGIE